MRKWILAMTCPLAGIVGLASNVQYLPLWPLFWFLLGVLGMGGLAVLWPRLFPLLLGRRLRLASEVVMRSCPGAREQSAAARLAADLGIDFAAATGASAERRDAEGEKLVVLWALLWRARAMRRRAFLGAPLPVNGGWRYTAIEELLGDVAEFEQPGSGARYARFAHDAHQRYLGSIRGGQAFGAIGRPIAGDPVTRIVAGEGKRPLAEVSEFCVDAIPGAAPAPR